MFKTFLCSIAMAATLLGGGAFAQSSAVQLLIQKAHSLEGRGRYDLAAQTWQQVLATDPNESEALAGMARFTKRAGKTEEAASYLERLRQVDPHNPALTEIESLKPASDERSKLDAAAHLAAHQQFAQAMAIFRDVFGDNPPPGGWAIAYYETEASLPDGWEKATSALRHLSERYPAVQEYKLSLGRLLTYRPSTRLAGVNLLESVQGGGGEKARQAWRQALVWEKANPSYLASMRAYVDRYHDVEIEGLMQTLVAGVRRAEATRGTPQSREEQLGYEALKEGNLAEAEKHFQAALQENGTSSQALAGMGYVRMKQQDFPGAVRFFEKAKHIAPDEKSVKEALETSSFWAKMREGTKSLGDGDEDAAIANFRAALAARPNSPEAIQGLAGALIKNKNFSEALPFYERLVQMQSNNADAWRQLVWVKYQADGPGAALTAMRLIPDPVALKLKENAEYLASAAQIYAAAGEDLLGQAAFRQVLALTNQRADDLPVDMQVQIAGLMLRFKKPAEAAQRMLKLVDQQPENVDAWEILLAALVANHRERSAAEALQRIPEAVYSAGLTRSNFLRSVASIQAANGKLEEAEEALQKLADSQRAKGTADLVGTQLQLANVYLKEGHADKAEELLNELTDANPDNPDVWKTFSSMLHEKRRDAEVIALRQRMPRRVATHLSTDYDYIAVLASAQNATGNPDGAMRLLNGAIAKAKSSGNMAPVSLELQLSWLLLESPQGQPELFSILEHTQARSDLTPAESRQIADLWSTWISRTADNASASGDLPRAVAVLDQGCRILPNDSRLKRSLAGYLLKAGDTHRALNIYKNWGLNGGTASDYAGAIGAAMNQRDSTYANAWLQEALAKWPADAELLNMAGKQAAATGDYKKAKAYWREALVASQQHDQAGAMTAGLKAASPSSSTLQLRQLLLGNSAQIEDPSSDTDPVQPAKSVDAGLVADATDAYSGAAVRMASYNIAGIPNAPVWLPPPVNNKTAPLLAASSPLANSLAEPAAERSESDAIQDQLASIEGRNTPYLGNTDIVQNRSGQAGYDRMLLEQANLEASTTIGDQIRMSLIAKPTYVQSGTANGQSTLGFGTAPAGSTSAGLQTASGLAAEGQISSQTFGLRIGAAPEGFLVKNLIGGVRVTPRNGPITLLLDRDSITDTLLSFAGTKDPETGTVWGGVVADTASVIGHWGDDRSGFYASAGYQWITGRNVEKNTRIDGNAGTYWKVLTRKEGALTLGLNLSAMHYDKNLRFFTLGQGGYFSPQQYFLFNVPMRWVGNYRQRLQYTVAASLGSQHFEEDASPLYPTQPWRSCTICSYASQASNGANYNIEAKLAYQMSPNWFVGFWANGNNARDYSSQSAGIFVKYSFDARPLVQENELPSIPDWKGQQPFRLF